MKVTVIKKEEVEVKFVFININPRHLDEEEKPVPMLKGDTWDAIVDINTGIIRDWPQGEEREYYWKICDAGSYHLLDSDEQIVLSINNNYVPNNLLPGEWGDYLELKINGDGLITNWLSNPTAEDFYKDDED
ncbi:MAG: hypothetical protein MJK15_03975 [Colwellia sp.]|nr:hypothetical protein [Colwellia sp.]